MVGFGLGSQGRKRGLDEVLSDPFARLAGLGDPDEADLITKDALLEYFDENRPPPRFTVTADMAAPELLIEIQMIAAVTED